MSCCPTKNSAARRMQRDQLDRDLEFVARQTCREATVGCVPGFDSANVDALFAQRSSRHRRGGGGNAAAGKRTGRELPLAPQKPQQLKLALSSDDGDTGVCRVNATPFHSAAYARSQPRLSAFELPTVWFPQSERDGWVGASESH